MGSRISKGITVAFTGSAGGSLTAELLDINLDPVKTDQIDVTHQASADGFRSFLSGLHDGQAVNLTLNFDSDNVRPAYGEAGSLVITLPAGTLKTCTIPCNVEEIGGMDAPLGQKMGENIKFKINGKPVWS
jgi:hypothetical protein